MTIAHLPRPIIEIDPTWFDDKTNVDGDRETGIWFYRNLCNNPVYHVVIDGVFWAWFDSLEAALHRMTKG